MKKLLIVAIILLTFLAGCKQQATELNFHELEEKYNAQIGVYVLDTNDNSEIAYNADERFAYCSTHNFLSVGAILKRKSLDELAERRFFSQEEILPYSAITKAHVADGLTVAEICEASLRIGDNTAANLVIAELGGVDEFKASLRAMGDNVTEPAHLEPELNYFSPDSIDDTSTPRQLAKNLGFYLLSDFLNDEKKSLMMTWLSDNSVTDDLIKTAVPKDWKVLDKNGTGINYGTCNDIAVVYPPNKNPIVVAIMTRRNEEGTRFDNAIVAEVARMIFTSTK